MGNKRLTRLTYNFDDQQYSSTPQQYSLDSRAIPTSLGRLAVYDTGIPDRPTGSAKCWCFGPPSWPITTSTMRRLPHCGSATG